MMVFKPFTSGGTTKGGFLGAVVFVWACPVKDSVHSEARQKAKVEAFTATLTRDPFTYCEGNHGNTLGSRARSR